MSSTKGGTTRLVAETREPIDVPQRRNCPVCGSSNISAVKCRDCQFQFDGDKKPIEHKIDKQVPLGGKIWD